MSTDQNDAETGRLGDDAPVATGNEAGGRRQTPTAGAAIRQLRSGSDVAEVQLSEAVIHDAIAVRRQQLENADRRSEREYSDRKHSRNWGAALVGMVILAVTAVVIILIYQGILDFLREMAMIVIPALGGIGVGVAIGFRMGIRYSNSRNRQ